MSDPNYNIRYQNDTRNLTITPPTYDTSTSLDLFGQNATNSGSGFWSNIVHLLENFYNENEPRNAVKGQLWYDGKDLLLCTKEPSSIIDVNDYMHAIANGHYRSDAEWVTINTSAHPTTIVSSIAPDTTNLVSGTIWYDVSTSMCRILVVTDKPYWSALNHICVASKPLTTADIGEMYFNSNRTGYGLYVCTGIKNDAPVWTNVTTTQPSPTITPIIGEEPNDIQKHQLFVRNNVLTFNSSGINAAVATLINDSLQVRDPIAEHDVVNKRYLHENIIPVKLRSAENAKPGELYYAQTPGYTSANLTLKTDDELVTLLSVSNVLALPVNSSVPNTSAAGAVCFTSSDNALNLFASGKWCTIPTFQNTNNFTGANKFAQTIISTTTEAPFSVASSKLVANLNVGHINNVKVTGVASAGAKLTAIDKNKAVWVNDELEATFTSTGEFELNKTRAGAHTCIIVDANVNIANDIAVGKCTKLFNNSNTDITINGNVIARLLGSVNTVQLAAHGVCEITCIDTNSYLVTGDIHA